LNEEKKMKRFRNLLIFCAAVAALFLAARSARADSLTLTLDAPFQTGHQTAYDFTGVIDYTGVDSINDGGVTEYLNGDSASLTAGASLDDSPFINNAPLSLNPAGTSGDFDIFNVTVPAYINGPPSEDTYIGSFSILGGPTSSDAEVLATVDFDIVVTPEPSSWLLLASGLGGLLMTMKARGRSSVAVN
jgi:hypothetical protein